MSNYTQTENGYLIAEAQGPFAPESLPNTPEGTVFSREFSNGEHVVTVSASPFQDDAEDEPEFWEVLVCTESREVGDDSGNTSEYEWDSIGYGFTLDDAIAEARSYIESLDPSRDLA